MMEANTNAPSLETVTDLGEDETAQQDTLLNFAQIDIDGMAVVILAQFVMGAVVRPAALTPLPRSHATIEGVFTYEEQLIPLVDLRKWLNPSLAHQAPQPYVILLRSGGKVIGLAVDAVHGMIRIPRSHRQQILRDCAADSFFQHVVKSDKSDRLFSQLDPLVLMNQVQVWADAADAITGATQDQDLTHSASKAKRQSTTTGAQVIVRAGTSILAIPATQVAEVIPMPPIDDVFALADRLLGLTHWHDTTVAVLDLIATLGLESSPQQAQLLLILDHDGLTAAIPVNQVLAVRSFPIGTVDTDFHSQPGFQHFYLGTTLLDNQERVMLVDGVAILAACPLNDLSDKKTAVINEVNTDLANAKQQNSLVTSAHIVFFTDLTWAIDMRHLKEIVPVPASYKANAETDDSLIGTCEWRGNYLPVLNPNGAVTGEVLHKKLIVVNYEGKDAGILVNDILELIPAHRGTQFSFTPPNGILVRMMTVNVGSDQRSYRIFDLSSVHFFKNFVVQAAPD